MLAYHMKIGIFDSGLGGLITLHGARGALASYDVVYLGDTKNLPYGDKTQEEIYALTKRALDFLKAQDCAIIFLFCNTASAMALRQLQHEGYRTLGIIIPTVEEATGSRIGILATQSTVDSGKYPAEIKKPHPNAQVFQQAAPKLVPLIESGNAISDALLLTYLNPLIHQNIKVLILGCTHYAILKTQIKKLIPHDIKIISQDEIIGPKITDYLARHPEIESTLSKTNSREYLVTKLTPEFEKQAKMWFGESLKLQEIEY